VAKIRRSNQILRLGVRLPPFWPPWQPIPVLIGILKYFHLFLLQIIPVNCMAQAMYFGSIAQQSLVCLLGEPKLLSDLAILSVKENLRYTTYS
jgi:hypothetical protein